MFTQIISLNEYLLSKKNRKLQKLPKIGCSIQDVIDWIKSFGIEEQTGDNYDMNLTYTILETHTSNGISKEIVGLEYNINQEYYSIELDPSINDNCSTIHDFMKSKEVSFDKAIEIAEMIISVKDNPKELINIIKNV